ncbi:MAG: hypothetical protein JST29_03535 [Bacteroidetes bacterium]|nr:hypothetical protein [Bacteroidota bacterium]MBS1590778.1 hypothetical protein [Bacteroidota bacterium]
MANDNAKQQFTMAEWNDFFVAVAGASAALTGLIFVGISISLTKILSIQGLPDRALLSLLLLLNVLIISILFLVPQQTTKAIGIEVLVFGIIVWVVVLKLDLRIYKQKQNRYRLPYVFYFVIDHLATVPFVIAGFALIINCTNAEYWVLPAIIFSIVKAVLDGWVLLVEINR